NTARRRSAPSLHLYSQKILHRKSPSGLSVRLFRRNHGGPSLHHILHRDPRQSYRISCCIPPASEPSHLHFCRLFSFHCLLIVLFCPRPYISVCSALSVLQTAGSPRLSC